MNLCEKAPRIGGKKYGKWDADEKLEKDWDDRSKETQLVRRRASLTFNSTQAKASVDNDDRLITAEEAGAPRKLSSEWIEGLRQRMSVIRPDDSRKELKKAVSFGSDDPNTSTQPKVTTNIGEALLDPNDRRATPCQVLQGVVESFERVAMGTNPVNAAFVLQKMRMTLAQTAMELALRGKDLDEMERAYLELQDAGAPAKMLAVLRLQLEQEAQRFDHRSPDGHPNSSHDDDSGVVNTDGNERYAGWNSRTSSKERMDTAREDAEERLSEAERRSNPQEILQACRYAEMCNVDAERISQAEESARWLNAVANLEAAKKKGEASGLQDACQVAEEVGVNPDWVADCNAIVQEHLDSLRTAMMSSAIALDGSENQTQLFGSDSASESGGSDRQEVYYENYYFNNR